jgi:hypothetical protein
LSDDEAVRVTVEPESVAPFEGVVILTEGAIESAETVMVVEALLSGAIILKVPTALPAEIVRVAVVLFETV